MEAVQKVPQLSKASGKVSGSAPNYNVADYGAALSITLAYMGDRLGLFKAMAYKGAMSPEEVALSCYLNESVVRDWLINTAAEGYLEYDPETGYFSLPDENAIALKDESSLLYVAGGLKVVEGMKKADESIKESFLRTNGAEIRDHQYGFLKEVSRYSKAEFIEKNFYTWLSALPGIVDKLNEGIKVADIGCSHGSSTLIMASAFPNSVFTGFEPHRYSVDRGNMMAIERRLRNAHFSDSGAHRFEGEEYGLITFFNCLHEVYDPLEAFKHCHKVLKKDGAIMVSEHLGGYITEASFEPLKRMFKGASILHCLLDGTGDPAINKVDGKDELEKVAREAGFTYYRRAIDTEFNRIVEIRP